MPIPKNCMNCQCQHHCNSAMYSKGCGFFPPADDTEEKINFLKKLFGKFFK